MKRIQNATYILVYQQQFRLTVTAWMHRRTSLENMQNYGVNLICVEDGIDSSKEAGKLLISIIAAVAEMERENIRVQTMAGREQKAREGKWNGGFAPYGYRLENGELVIAEDEVEEAIADLKSRVYELKKIRLIRKREFN